MAPGPRFPGTAALPSWRAARRPGDTGPVVDLEAMVGLARTGRCRPEQELEAEDTGECLTELAARLSLLFK